MRNMVLFVFVISAGVACSQAEPSGNKSAELDGAKIYKNYCISCHGLYGDMGASGAFNLTTSQITLDERIKVIREGRNTMTPFRGLLSDEKIKAVAEYTLQLKKQ